MTLNSIRSYLRKLPQRTRSILSTSVYGLAAGGAAVAFQLSINLLFNSTFVALSSQSKTIFLAGSFAVIMASSLAVGVLLASFCREAAGSGIPQLKLAFWKDFGYVPFRVVWVKFVAGIISIGGGSSLGREGPSVHFAGGLASNLGGLMGEAKQNRRNAAAAGAAAGLAAAFNTPLAAITFVLEEIIEDLNSRFLGSVLLASVIGALVVHGLVGKQPAFSLANDLEPSSWWLYAATPFVALAASIVGLTFQKSTLNLRARNKELTSVPPWLRPCLGGFITWVLGSAVFLQTHSLGIFGLGYGDLSTALSQGFSWKLAAILVVAKLITTIVCYGFGGCGGIFSPLLFLGGMTGACLGGIFGHIIHLSVADQIVLAVVGMSSCLGAVVRAPVTSILIVFEMTHEFSLVPILMLGTLVSQAIRHRFARHNFYEEILIQDGHELEHVIPPRDLQSWQQLPVSAIANFHPVILQSLTEDEIQKTLAAHPYGYFPVVLPDQPIQMLSRREAELARVQHRPACVEAATTCLASQTIRDLQLLLMESNQAVIIVLDRPNGKVLGILTLHDLLRAQVSLGKPDGTSGAITVG
ncbi:MAG TPA: chloride channel protein [Verrucomicrobiae bacterium]|nr:chloride channel protein [Verrucomicrobiae bacterium]